MIESDHSDKDSLNDSLDMNEHTKKRSREESGEDDKAHSSLKKLCTSHDKITLEENKSEYKTEMNGDITDNKEDAKDASVSTGSIKDTNAFSNEDVKCADTIGKDINGDSKVLDTKSENEKKEIYSIDNVRKLEAKYSTDSEYKDSVPVESEIDVDIKEVNTNNEETKEERLNLKTKRKRDKPQVDNAEVVEGLELSVECASDRESSSSSESENEKEKKPKAKTIIVKAKPNDSELDISSSEAEKSDLQDASEVKPKQNIKKGKRKARTSFSKSTDGNSEENDDVSDEDYSPRTKRKLKKTLANKRKSSSETKVSNDKVKKMDQQVDENVEEEEEENSDTIDDLKTEQVSSMKKLKSSDRKIEMLKKYIRTAGIRVKSYNTVWAGCKSGAAKVRCLQELLEKNGVTGKPTLEKCKKVKELNEKLKDIAELNTSNIISEGRITRAQRKRETPTEHREVRSTLKRVLRVVDSDSE
ncbi:uncharacterized protein LOC144476162 [Augochlora pura]